MKYRIAKHEYDSLTKATQDAVTLAKVTGKTWIIEVLFEGRWIRNVPTRAPGSARLI